MLDAIKVRFYIFGQKFTWFGWFFFFFPRFKEKRYIIFELFALYLCAIKPSFVPNFKVLGQQKYPIDFTFKSYRVLLVSTTATRISRLVLVTHRRRISIDNWRLQWSLTTTSIIDAPGAGALLAPPLLQLCFRLT